MQLKYNHKDLIPYAMKFLQRMRNMHIIATEIKAGSWFMNCEVPDALGWQLDYHGVPHPQFPNHTIREYYGYRSIMVECKATRSDFLAQRRKVKVEVGNARYYLTPEGLLKQEETEEWGLIEVRGKKILIVKESQHFISNQHLEIVNLIGLLRRLPDDIHGAKIAYYKWNCNKNSRLAIRRQRND